MAKLIGLGRVLGSTFIAQLIVQLQGLVVMPIVVRWAGPAIYGAYVILFVTAVVLFELATSSMSYPYIRNLVSASTAEERRRLFEPQITFCLVVFGFASLALLFVHPVKMEVGNGTSIFTFLLVGVVAANLLQRQALDYFRYTLRFVSYSVVLGGPSVVFMTSLLAYVGFGGVPSLDILLALQCVSALIVCLPFLTKMLGEIGIPRPHLPVRVLIRNVQSGLPMTIDGLVNFVLGFGDRYTISLFLSVAAVGHYQPSYQAGAIIFFLASLLCDVLSPLISRLVDIRQQGDAEELLTRFFRLFLMIAVPFIVGMLMVGPSFLGLLTTAEIATSGRWVIPLVAAATTVNAFVSFMRAVAMALNRLPTILTARLAGALLNIAFNLILLFLFADINVAAISMLIGYTVTSCYLVLSFRRTWRMPFEVGTFARFCAAAALMGAVLWIMGYRAATVAPESVIHLTGVIVTAVVVYFLALNVLGGFGRRELTLMAHVVQSRLEGRDAVRS